MMFARQCEVTRTLKPNLLKDFLCWGMLGISRILDLALYLLGLEQEQAACLRLTSLKPRSNARNYLEWHDSKPAFRIFLLFSLAMTAMPMNHDTLYSISIRTRRSAGDG